jgi:hypothetical protein
MPVLVMQRLDHSRDPRRWYHNPWRALDILQHSVVNAEVTAVVARSLPVRGKGRVGQLSLHEGSPIRLPQVRNRIERDRLRDVVRCTREAISGNVDFPLLIVD